MRKIRFIRSNHTLIAIILSTIQLIYIPLINAQKESKHINTIENQYAHLKYTIETQSVTVIVQGSLPIVYTPMIPKNK